MQAGATERQALIRLDEVRRKLPRLWARAATALGSGNEELARLALRRHQLLLGELAALRVAADSRPPRPRLLERIDAIDELLDASLRELARLCGSELRLPPTVHLDPAVEALLADIRRRSKR